MDALSRIVAGVATPALMVAARDLAETGWRTFKGDEPPVAETLSSDADLRDLYVWSAVLLASVFLARKVATSLARQLLR